MVFFACDKCGESLKKNQVEKHNYRCHSMSFSCIDCQNVFSPETYAEHIKCITENQKYGGKNYVEKEAKGEVKQNAWCQQVERATELVKDAELKELLRSIQGYGNIPRKEAKFMNFLANSCRIRNQNLCKRAWNAIADEADKLRKEAEEKKKAEDEEKRQAKQAAEEAKAAEEAAKKLDEKEASPSQNGSIGTFKWKSTIKRKLKEAGGEMKMKKLRTAVLEAYEEINGESCDAETFTQKLKKAGVVIDGKNVLLAAN